MHSLMSDETDLGLDILMCGMEDVHEVSTDLRKVRIFVGYGD